MIRKAGHYLRSGECGDGLGEHGELMVWANLGELGTWQGQENTTPAPASGRGGRRGRKGAEVAALCRDGVRST